MAARPSVSTSPPLPPTGRLARLDWSALEAELWERGHARLGAVLTPEECGALTRLYPDEGRFRSRIDMARHRFGVGEYK